MKANLLIVFYSMNGTNTQMARWASKAAQECGAKVQLRKVAETVPMDVIKEHPLWLENVEDCAGIEVVSEDDLDWADAIIFASPSRFGVMAAQFKLFLDGLGGFWAQGRTVNKFVTAMTSANNFHGGQERVIDSIYTVMQHWGAIIVPTGFVSPHAQASGGNPYGISATIDPDGNIIDEEAVKGAIGDHVRRLLRITSAYNKGVLV
ncbi:NAD(P)H:quinone oxidoreductase type IV [Ignatzschineria sp. RMDPL8A]|uniref:NAD(P)H:quinone oxidoreductase type IV n=1 Tax=Ignatzschineria sp. RMDPL8A TaxID=2999236 RepID=UPI0016B178E7|nr:NAD(P)H:quinone oxidoreductase type IV [Ignatzschineria sp. RMDPL8A]MDG9729089.1 NAD(P)H:quinone oxidoreductase type IV [Ignatzschineria sp. RMDPL8A]NLD08928.1 NAD(P)H:quinone oxidoreductase type IV [Xanthomonadaceae bacterium]